jgi:hypothetical protein
VIMRPSSSAKVRKARSADRRIIGINAPFGRGAGGHLFSNPSLTLRCQTRSPPPLTLTCSISFIIIHPPPPF